MLKVTRVRALPRFSTLTSYRIILSGPASRLGIGASTWIAPTKATWGAKSAVPRIGCGQPGAVAVPCILQAKDFNPGESALAEMFRIAMPSKLSPVGSTGTTVGEARSVRNSPLHCRSHSIVVSPEEAAAAEAAVGNLSSHGTRSDASAGAMGTVPLAETLGGSSRSSGNPGSAWAAVGAGTNNAVTRRARPARRSMRGHAPGADLALLGA
jgi:hypothetical protein